MHSSSAGDLLAVLEVKPSHSCKDARPDAKQAAPMQAWRHDAPHAKPLGFAIVGMGRAGNIHLGVLKAREDADVRWLVDINPARSPAGATNTSALDVVLADPLVDCVIVSTPTPSHAPVIRQALQAGKHVFAEKPLCCEPSDVPALFALADERGLLLHTAFNRRHDPKIKAALEEVRRRKHGRVLGATLVSRDFPYPPASYLATSGNLFKDCVVHDLDYLTWLLDEKPTTLRAHASTSGDERSQGMWEYSEVHLQLASGATATLINGRVSDSYDHRLDIYCEEGVVRVSNPTADEMGGKTAGVTFGERFEASYHAQIAAFITGVRAVSEEAAAPADHVNIDAARTMLLEELIAACHASVASGGHSIPIGDAANGKAGSRSSKSLAEVTDTSLDASASSTSNSPRSSSPSVTALSDAGLVEPSASVPPPAALRTYDDTTSATVKALYRTMRNKQSVEHVRRLRAKYTAPGKLGSVRMSVWDAMEHLKSFVDVSDPDMTLPNIVHAFQTAEGLRAARLPDWLQLTGLIHDLGKMITVRGCDEDGTSISQQWSIVGDTWIVGCAMPSEMVYPEFNQESPDAVHSECRTSECGIYERGCGLDQTLCAFGHDEYMYQVLAQNPGVKLPKEALYCVRYHSLYPWHDQGCYEALENDFDRSAKGWVKLFNQHDLYTKDNVNYSDEQMAELKVYYSKLVDKYLPAELDW